MSNDESNRDNGYFAAMRRCHPVKLGDTIEGKRVVMSAFRHQPGLGNLPIYRLDGENEARTIGAAAIKKPPCSCVDGSMCYHVVIFG